MPAHFVRDGWQGPLEHGAGRRFLLALQGIPEAATMVCLGSRPAAFPGASTESRRLRLIPVPTPGLRESGVRRLLRRLRRLDRWYLYGHPSALAWIAEITRRRRARPSPLAVVTTAETLTPDSQALLEEVFECARPFLVRVERDERVRGGDPAGDPPLRVEPAARACGGARQARPLGGSRRAGADRAHRPQQLRDAADPVRHDDVGVASAETLGGLPLLEEIVGRSSETLRLPSGRIVSPLTLGMRLFVGAEALVPYIRAYQCAAVGPQPSRAEGGVGARGSRAGGSSGDHGVGGKSWVVRREDG